MAGFRISRAARADLAQILESSLERWGVDGRARYAALLAESIRRLAAAPEGATTRARAELGAGLRSFHARHARGTRQVHAPVHVIDYRLAEAGWVEIVRVLHERMEPSGRVAPVRRSRRRRPSG